MALVTVVPRIAPAWLLERMHLPARVEAWLAHVPYAVLGALIFPGIMTVQPDRPEVGLAGGAVAVLLAWLRLPVLVVIGAAIAAVMALKWAGV